MHSDVLAIWHQFSEPFEGRIPYMYQDVKGLVTCGVGNLIDPLPLALRLPWHAAGVPATLAEIEAEWREVKAMAPALPVHKYRTRRGLRLTDRAIVALVRTQIMANESVLRRVFPGWDTWPADAQLGTMSLAWACGADVSRGWPRFTDACRRRDWPTAARECQIKTEGNPGVRARNEAQAVCFTNAAAAEANPLALPPGRVWWPLRLELRA